MTHRTEKLNDLLRDEISYILQRQVRDPRLSGVVTITQVQVSADLTTARIFASVLGDTQEQARAMAGLEAATGFLRRELAQRVSLRRIPRLTFHQDTAIQEGIATYQLIKKVSQEKEEQQTSQGA